MINVVQSQASLLVAQGAPKGANVKTENTNQTKETDRATAIKEQIANGTYALDMDKTVKAIAQELLG
jgi:anti-sigma28 factor (negative regulator of flagellin synthesis)